MPDAEQDQPATASTLNVRSMDNGTIVLAIGFTNGMEMPLAFEPEQAQVIADGLNMAINAARNKKTEEENP